MYTVRASGSRVAQFTHLSPSANALVARASSWRFFAFRSFHASKLNRDEAQPVRNHLTSELKNAMKAKDTFASNAIRSILAEVYAADKNWSGKADNAAVVSILRKALTRRAESASEFRVASRSDLAETEVREAEFLSSFLPPSMSEADIDAVLEELVKDFQNVQPKPRAVGMLMKAFYSRVDKARVDGAVVKERAELMLNS